MEVERPAAAAEVGLSSRRTVRRRYAAASGVFAVAALLAGCTSEGGDVATGRTGGTPSLQAPTPATSDPVAGAERAAMEAYRGMWDAYVEAISIPDPELPALVRFAADDALAVLVDGIEQVERDGLAGRGDVMLDPEVIGLAPSDVPTAVEIADCVDTSDSELYRRDGQPYEDTPGGLRRAEAAVREVGGDQWKVVGFALYEVGSCER